MRKQAVKLRGGGVFEILKIWLQEIQLAADGSDYSQVRNLTYISSFFSGSKLNMY